jgi:RimJ/RimL family protein N-acetyltransferase
MASLPPPSFVIHTENYTLRRMVRDDASPMLEAWTEDELLAEMLNAQRRSWTVAEQVAYFSGYDGKTTRYLLGIFPNSQSEPIGFFIVKVRLEDSLMLVTHFLGDKTWRGTGASREASVGLFDYFFNKLSFAKAKANVRAVNKAVQWLLLNGGWRIEARLHKHLRMKTTGERSDIIVFGILADEWRAGKDSAKTVRRRSDRSRTPEIP